VIAGVALYSLLRRFRPAPESVAATPQQHAQSEAEAEADLRVPAVILRAMFPATLVFAMFLLLRGHNLPGGGFVAGLTLAIAFILQYMHGGTLWFEQRLNIVPLRWAAVGLLIAAGTGFGAWLFDHPFLTSHVLHVSVPLLGDLHLPSAFLFDIGVFAAVLGATLLLLVTLAHQSLRADRRPRDS
jgi:multicomponent K+:H+ antiporter subunit A